MAGRLSLNLLTGTNLQNILQLITSDTVGLDGLLRRLKNFLSVPQALTQRTPGDATSRLHRPWQGAKVTLLRKNILRPGYILLRRRPLESLTMCISMSST